MRVTSLEELSKGRFGVKHVARISEQESYDVPRSFHSDLTAKEIPEKHLIRYLSGGFTAKSPAIDVYEISNAIVLPNCAVFTLNGRIIADSLYPYLHYSDVEQIFERRLRRTSELEFDTVISECEYYDGSLFSARDHGEAGFFHFLHSVIPRKLIWQQNFREHRLYAARGQKFHDEFDSASGIEAGDVVFANGRALAVSSLLFATGLVRPDWDTGGFFERPLACTRMLRTWAQQIAPASDERIYISRKDSSIRKVGNEADLESHLIDKWNFRSCVLTDMSLLEQISLFKGAQCVVGLHGAGLSHVSFMPNGSDLVEIFPQSRIWPTFHGIACRSAVKYSSVVMSDSTKISLSEIDEALESILGSRRC